MSAPQNHVPTLRLKSPAELLRKDRLPSFKTRDLTLGGIAGINIKAEPKDAAAANANKKVFKPNLNVARTKNADVRTSRDNTANNRGRSGVRADRGGRNDRGAKRGSTLIQTQGVFSEGASGTAHKRQSSSYRSYNSRDVSGSVAEFLTKPTFNKADIKVDLEVERKQINEILADEEEDKLSSDSDKVMPICLKSYPKIKQEITDLTTKVEHIDTGTEGEGLGDFMEQQDSSLFLMQFSDTLPGLAPESKLVDSKVGILDEATSSSGGNSNTESDNYCTLRHLPEGLIGELVRYRSGRMVLVLGDNHRFDVTHGADSSFLQEVVSISTNRSERSGTIVNLGKIQGRLAVSPDWSQLLGS